MHQKIGISFTEHVSTYMLQRNHLPFLKASYYYKFLRENGFAFTSSISGQFLMLNQSHFFPSDSNKKLQLSAIYIIKYSFLNIKVIFQFKQSKCEITND